MRSRIAVAIFTLAAIGEIVNDKLPKTPARTAPPSLVIRILMGAFAAVTLAIAGGASPWIGAVAGALGAVAGTFGGYHVRKALVQNLHVPDFAIALVEDVIAVGGGLFIVSRL
jgi:uncharacterized membrane protein